MTAEERIRADPEWQAGMAWGEPRPGHPEGTIANHVEEVLANVEHVATDERERERLRLIALVHDAFKHQVAWWLPGRRDHARLAARFAARHVDDAGIVSVVARHDDGYRAWRLGRRTGLWPVAEWRARSLIRDLGDHLDLFRAFYRCDNETGDKAPDDRVWFEALCEETAP